MKKILVTGGLGYIGSHTVVALISEGYEVEIIDDLSNSRIEILDQIFKITNVKPKFHKISLLDKKKTADILKLSRFDAVIHFAAFKSVGESMDIALKYYDNNLGTLVSLLLAMEHSQTNNLIFSSSCTVYGETNILPVTEESPIQTSSSVYGTTKLMAEKMISDIVISKESNINAISLRYFNPAGAHSSALIGELPSGTPNNLFPYITQTYSGKRNVLSVFGADYNTPDGTAIRDYIHVVDLAKAHVKSVERLLQNNGVSKFEYFNIGTGTGYSVLNVINAFEEITGLKLNYQIVGRREGDIEQIWANVDKANKILNWEAQYGLNDIVKSAWEWEQYIISSDWCD